MGTICHHIVERRYKTHAMDNNKLVCMLMCLCGFMLLIIKVLQMTEKQTPLLCSDFTQFTLLFCYYRTLASISKNEPGGVTAKRGRGLWGGLADCA